MEQGDEPRPLRTGLILEKLTIGKVEHFLLLVFDNVKPTIKLWVFLFF